MADADAELAGMTAVGAVVENRVALGRALQASSVRQGAQSATLESRAAVVRYGCFTASAKYEGPPVECPFSVVLRRREPEGGAPKKKKTKRRATFSAKAKKKPPAVFEVAEAELRHTCGSAATTGRLRGNAKRAIEALLDPRTTYLSELARRCAAVFQALKELPADVAAVAAAERDGVMAAAARVPHAALVTLLAELGVAEGRDAAIRRCLPRAASVAEVAALLAAGGDASSVTELGEAVGRPRVLEALLDAGTPATSGAALGKAAGAMSLGLVKLLLSRGCPVDQRGEHETTALIEAAKASATSATDSTEVLEALLDAGADMEAADARGFTALAHSCGAYNPAAFHVLLRRGAAPNGAPGGMPPLAVAGSSMYHGAQATRMPRHRGEKERSFPPTGPIMGPALLDAGADVNARTPFGVGATVLSHCMAPSFVNRLSQYMLKLLLERGADPCCTDGAREPAAFILVRSRPALLRPLFRAGFPPSTTDSRGRTLLHKLVDQRNNVSLEGVVDEVLGSGVDVDTPDNGGNTPLMAAASGYSRSVCKLLLGRGADPHRVNNAGESASSRGLNNSCAEVRSIFFQLDRGEKRARVEAEAERRALKAATAALLPSVLVDLAASYAAEQDGTEPKRKKRRRR